MKPSTKSTYILLVIAELFFICQFLLVWYPSYGIYASAAAIVTLFIFSLKRPHYAPIAACIAILFAIRLVSATLSFEDPGISALVLYTTLAVTLIIFSLIRAWPNWPSERMHAQNSGMFALMFLTGEFLGIACWLFLPMDDPYRILPPVLLVITAPLAAAIEEYIFRNVIQKDATEATDTLTGILFTVWIAAAFGLSKSTPYVFTFLAAQFLLSVAYSRTKSSTLTFIANLSMKLTFIVLLALRTTIG